MEFDAVCLSLVGCSVYMTIYISLVGIYRCRDVEKKKRKRKWKWI